MTDAKREEARHATGAKDPIGELRVFCNGTDKVVAHDEQDAKQALAELIGCSVDDGDVADCDPFELVPSDKVLTISFNDGECAHLDLTGLRREQLGGERFRVATTAADWVRRNGRGMLCSTEF